MTRSTTGTWMQQGGANFEQRRAHYMEAQQRLVDYGPVIIPFFRNYISAVNNRVHGWEEWWTGTEERLYDVTVDPR